MGSRRFWSKVNDRRCLVGSESARQTDSCHPIANMYALNDDMIPELDGCRS